MGFRELNNENLLQIKSLLDNKYRQYNTLDFIETDPIQIPHQFVNKYDIEIAAFLTASIAWGQRRSIIKNAKSLITLMDNEPYNFISNVSKKELERFNYFVHRTFQGIDCVFFIKSLKNIYQNHTGLEPVFKKGFETNLTIYNAIKYFREIFFSIPHPVRTNKHVSNVLVNSSAKRINMFLRWMVRMDSNEVDFGIWKSIPIKSLMLPLDVHTGSVARNLQILQRKQNDWLAVEEITAILRQFDPIDPVKYDFALFGIGAFDGQKIR